MNVFLDLVMELAMYGTIADWIRKKSNLGAFDLFSFIFIDFPTTCVCFFVLGEDVVKSVTKQLCSAINYLHENGIIHRDLKPAVSNHVL